MRLLQLAAPFPRVLLAAAGAVVALGTTFGPASLATAATAATPSPAVGATGPVVPATPAALPTAMEPLASYVPAVSCDSTDKPGSTNLGTLLTATYPGTTYAVSRACGSDAMSTTEHYDGRAVDWFTNARTADGKARGEALVSWLTATDARGNVAANARRLGVMYIIWNNRIWGAYRPADGWRPYSGCASTPSPGSDTACHRNHVHLSLSWAGAMARTSWWTRTVAGPDYGPCRLPDLNWAPAYTAANPRACPSYPRVSPQPGASALNRSLVAYSGMTLQRGSTGPAVSAVQTAVGGATGGTFGDLTVSAVSAFQSGHGLLGDGVVGPQTWRALLKATAPVPAPTSGGPYDAYENTVLRVGSTGTAVKVLQQALHLALVDGNFGPGTRSAVIAFQTAHQLLPADGVVTAPVWRALGAAAKAAPSPAPAPKGKYAAYEKVTLKLGDRNASVKVLQKALAGPLVDGDFGPKTKASVIAFQSKHHLTANGIVTAVVWRALG
jgi:peptidoglycan hydrolase-like protein with peptidoglycan-binding domain